MRATVPEQPGSATAPWFVPMVEDPDRPVRVLAMPQAGGGCATFADLADRLGAGAALYGLNLPGRQARFGEPARTDLSGLVTDLTDALAGFTDRPYTLVGYCTGAALAFLVARAAHEAGLPPPRSLVAISFPAPQFTSTDQDMHTLPEEEFWDRIIASGGFPEELATQLGYQQVFEPALRADYALFAGFRHRDTVPLPLDVSVVAGRADPALPDPTHLIGWRDHTSGVCSVHWVDGDHWLLDDAAPTVARIVEDACRDAPR